MKVTGVKTYVVENEPGERSGGGDPMYAYVQVIHV